MERKVGERFYLSGIQYECIEQEYDCMYCHGCDYDTVCGCSLSGSPDEEFAGECGSDAREDGKDVIFVRVEY